MRAAWPAAAALALVVAAPAAWCQYGGAPPVRAPTTGYLSLGGGVSSFSTGCGGGTQCDRVDNTVRAAAGLFVIPDLALELAAADFGNSRIGTPYGDATFGVRMVGLGIALPLEYGARFNGLLRVGLARVEARLQGVTANAPAPSSSTSVEGYYGFTMGYMLTNHLAAELSFDGTRAYTADAGGRVDALTLGLSLRF